MQVALVTTNEAFLALQGEWDDLVSQCDEDNPFRRWFWNHCWWKHFGHKRQLAIVVAREAGQLVGLAPCFIERDHWWRGARVMRLLGATEEVCSEHLGIITRAGYEAQVVPQLLEYLCHDCEHKWDVLRLTELPSHSAQIPVIDQFVSRHGMAARQQQGHICHLVRFTGDWDDYVRSLDTKRRTKLNRNLREFAVEKVEVAVAETPADLPARFNELCQLHNHHWQTLGQPGLFETPAFAAFHREIAEHFLPRQMLLLGSLWINGEAVASSYSLRLNGVAYEYQRGHNPAWITRRPGHVLQFLLFRYAIEHGVRCWDYLRGDYPHKRDWANDARTSMEIQIAAPRKLQVARLHLEERVEQAKDRLRQLRDAARERKENRVVPLTPVEQAR